MEPYSSDDVKRKKRKNDPFSNKFLEHLPEVTAAVILTPEGLPIASMLPQGVDETKIAAMTAALLSLSEKTILEIGKGSIDQLCIKGSEGYLLVMQAGPGAVLIVSTTKDARLGLVLSDCRRTCEKIAQLIGGTRVKKFRRAYPKIQRTAEKPAKISARKHGGYDATFKIILFGDKDCGKETITQRFLTNLFVSDQTMTIGVDFEVKSLTVDGQKVKLQIWDFGGEERFRFLLPTYVRGARGGLFVYDITNYSSITHIDDWLSVVKKEIRAEDMFPIIVIGNKAHLITEREVSSADGIKIAKSRGVNGFVEVSAETGENVERAFEALTRLMLDESK
ncbi:MAG: GTP-binding protein [Candidatus Hermodarchaeota archaeon]